MAPSNRDRVGKAFELLAQGLAPFVDAHMKKSSFGEDWIEMFVRSGPKPDREVSLDDPSFLLLVMSDQWEPVFRRQLDRSQRSVIFELRDFRNKWAHNAKFSYDDTYRTLDSVERLLDAVDAHQTEAAAAAKDEFARTKYESTPAAEGAGGTKIVEKPTGGLTPWRTVVTPHDDVVQGRFSVAEFAADLDLVRRGQGAAEYVDPARFFERTYLTAGLRQLLSDAVQRVTGGSGSPVVNLQTNFGGGKTHSLIALYHLLSGVDRTQFPDEIGALLDDAGVGELPAVRRAVLVGNKLDPGSVETKPDGTEVRTLWGELAWQLGGSEGFAHVADADAHATNPGDRLRKLLEAFAPCLVLVDEWVAYARQLYTREDLPAGSFDTQFTFAQTLTEAAKAVPGALFVVSIPASQASEDVDSDEAIGSEVEVGGPGGREALRRLTNVVSRVASHWRPASSEESFEIVRRRLFEPIGADQEAARDATAGALAEMYRKERSEFPTECSEVRYLERMKAAYPIHPELFDRLYEDWSSVDRFQRTRGVLRLMAQVIHALWVGNDHAPLIMPSSVPLDESAVNAELTRNLEDNWKPVIDRDVDGPTSTPAEIDRRTPNLGRYHAARRVARTIFMGTAPTVRSANRGIDAARVRLGSAFPGESVAIFGDALNRLTDESTYLYVERNRYWFDLQESINRTAQQEAERLLATGVDHIDVEIIRRLGAERSEHGDFRGVHVAPATSADVDDTDLARLVILDPDHPHIAKAEDSRALESAAEILERRGSSPRQYRNMVVFVAADQRRLEDLRRAAAEYLAWSRIDDEAGDRNLDETQRRQAATRRKQADDTVDLRLTETYQWAIVPDQPRADEKVELTAVKLDGQGSIAQRASRKLVHDGLLQTQFPPVMLRVHLDGDLQRLWEDGDVSAGALWDAFAKYTYLPRLRDIDILLQAVREGPASTSWQSEGFATADLDDADAGRYRGLTVGSHPSSATAATLVVRPDVAIGQVEAEREAPTGTEGEEPADESGKGAGDDERPRYRRYHGSRTLDPQRPGRDFSQALQEVIEHLTALGGTDVRITVDVEATAADGFPDEIVRIVNENARTLKFDDSGFEE